LDTISKKVLLNSLEHMNSAVTLQRADSQLRDRLAAEPDELPLYKGAIYLLEEVRNN